MPLFGPCSVERRDAQVVKRSGVVLAEFLYTVCSIKRMWQRGADHKTCTLDDRLSLAPAISVIDEGDIRPNSTQSA